jgi:hypothetical protein
LNTAKKAAFSLATNHGLFAPVPPLEASTVAHRAAPPCPARLVTVLPTSLLSATSDQEAVESWIAARAGSMLTATAYRREAMRLAAVAAVRVLGQNAVPNEC